MLKKVLTLNTETQPLPVKILGDNKQGKKEMIIAASAPRGLRIASFPQCKQELVLLELKDITIEGFVENREFVSGCITWENGASYIGTFNREDTWFSQGIFKFNSGLKLIGTWSGRELILADIEIDGEKFNLSFEEVKSSHLISNKNSIEFIYDNYVYSINNETGELAEQRRSENKTIEYTATYKGVDGYVSVTFENGIRIRTIQSNFTNLINCVEDRKLGKQTFFYSQGIKVEVDLKTFEPTITFPFLRTSFEVKDKPRFGITEIPEVKGYYVFTENEIPLTIFVKDIKEVFELNEVKEKLVFDRLKEYLEFFDEKFKHLFDEDTNFIEKKKNDLENLLIEIDSSVSTIGVNTSSTLLRKLQRIKLEEKYSLFEKRKKNPIESHRSPPSIDIYRSRSSFPSREDREEARQIPNGINDNALAEITQIQSVPPSISPTPFKIVPNPSVSPKNYLSLYDQNLEARKPVVNENSSKKNSQQSMHTHIIPQKDHNEPMIVPLAKESSKRSLNLEQKPEVEPIKVIEDNVDNLNSTTHNFNPENQNTRIEEFANKEISVMNAQKNLETEKNRSNFLMESFSIFKKEAKPIKDISNEVLVQGTVIKGSKEGYCKVFYSNQETYFGWFNNNMRNGLGTLFTNQEIFHGNFKNDKPVGKFSRTVGKHVDRGEFIKGKFCQFVQIDKGGYIIEFGIMDGKRVNKDVKVVFKDGSILFCEMENEGFANKQEVRLCDTNGRLLTGILMMKERSGFFWNEHNDLFKVDLDIGCITALR